MREVAQWLAHLVWDQGAAGSSPVFPTIRHIIKSLLTVFDFEDNL